MGTQPTIEAANLSFSYGERVVFCELSFTVEPDEFVSFIGPSGCGKTTLLAVLAGISSGHTGSVLRRTESVSFVFQHDSLLEWRDARRNVLLPFELAGTAVTPEVLSRADRMLDLVGLAGYEHHYPHELSGGMKKRVEIARALVTEPELLILDEPFSSLDIITRERLNILTKNIHQIRKSTVVLVTHSVEEACFLSDRIYVMSDAPSRIIHVTGIRGKERSSLDRFVLTDDEQSANVETRERATSFWGQGETAGTDAPGPARGLKRHAPPRQSRRASPPAPVPARAKATLAGRIPGWALFPAGLLAILVALVVLKTLADVPDFVFPHPLKVFARFGRTLADGTILPDLTMTIVESLSGFAVALAATMLLGYGIAKSRLLSRLLMPYLVAANTIPSVALAPFLVLWFGFGLAPRVITSVIVIFFPMLINNVSAFRLAEEATQDLASFYRPPPLRRFTKFELPAALPVVSSGIKVSVTLSVIGAVVGEFVAGATGLGSLVSRAKASFDVELMFVALLWLVALGLSYFAGAHVFFAVVQRRRRKPVTSQGSTPWKGDRS